MTTAGRGPEPGDGRRAGEAQSRERVLLVDGDAARAKAVGDLLKETGGYEPVHVPAVVGAIREITSRPYCLIVTDTTVQRGRDGLKLVRLVLREGVVAKVPPVVVVTAETDPSVVQLCLRAGVVDYILYPCDLQVLLQRVNRAAGQVQSLGERLVKVTTPYLGPAARVFVQQQLKAHLPGVPFDGLGPAHLPEVFRWLGQAGAKVVGTRAEELVRQLEATFGVSRAGSPSA